MKIVFWSPTSYAGRKSTHLLLLVLQTIQKEGGEQLVLHTDYNGSGPEHYLLGGRNRSRMEQQKEFGLELLWKRLQCESFKKELVVNSAYTFAEGKLHVLPSGSECFYTEREKEAAGAVRQLMECGDEVFQNVWVELPAGTSTFSKELLSAADCVVVNVAQSCCELERLNAIPEFRREFYLIGAYEKRNVFTMHNLELLYPRLRGRCAVIPYDAGCLAAWSEGEAEHFFLRGTNQRKSKMNTPFFQAVRKAYDGWRGGKNENETNYQKKRKGA